MDAPKQDWKLYESICREEHVAWLRRLTPSAALSLFEDMRKLALEWTPDPASHERMLAARWHEKVATRRKLLAAFAALDRHRA
jgi:hypothetical protein